MNAEIQAFNKRYASEDRQICDLLATTIDGVLTTSESKVWHAHPVWFLAGNPIVGYSKQKAGWRLMFWSGASFEEEQLNVIGGKFRDASVFYTSVEQVKTRALVRWLKKSREIQWDYKNIVKRKGRLELIAGKSDTRGMELDEKDSNGHDARIARMSFASVYPHYVTKVEKKGRTKDELHEVIEWLTGFNGKTIQKLIREKVSFETFFQRARLNPNASLITGTICGYRVEELTNPLTQKTRYLDKLVDELAKGRTMDRILRSPP